MELKLYCGSLDLGKRLGLNLKSPSQAHFTHTWLPVCGGVLKTVGTVGGGACLVALQLAFEDAAGPHTPFYLFIVFHNVTSPHRVPAATNNPCLPHYDSQDPLKL